MNRIKEQINRFNSLKNNLKNYDINELTKSGKTSILEICVIKKHNPSYSLQNSEKSQKNESPIQNSQEIKSKEKNKFFTQKCEEKNAIKDNRGKEIISNYKNQKNYSNKNSLTGNYLNGSKNNTNNGKGPESHINKINLLNLANGEIKLQEAKKFFQEERIEEKNTKILENQKNGEKKEEDKKLNNYDNEIDDDLEDLEDLEEEQSKEKEKYEKYTNKIKSEILKNNLILCKKESQINFQEKLELFANNDSDSNILDNEDDDNKSDKNNSPIKENNNQNIYQNYSYIINNNNNKKDCYITPFEDKENKNNENDKFNLSNSNSLKICIPIDDNYDNEKIQIFHPENGNKCVKKTYLGKKTKNKDSNQNNNIKIPNTPKSEQRIDKKNLEKINKKLKKIIMDEEDEEEYLERNRTTLKNDNLILTSPKIKTEKNNDNKPYLSKEGNKFTLMLDTEIKSTIDKPITKGQINPIKNNIHTSLAPPKNIIINNDNNSNEIKNNKNKINKNKNGSQNETDKNAINREDYDILCINNINKILVEIREKLSKEKINKNLTKDCFDIIEIIKKTKTSNDNIKRKKNAYTGIIRILQILFSQLSENKISKNYIKEIFQILEYTKNYFKNVKRQNESINNNNFYYKRKIAYKYVHSKLELKDYNKNSLKGLTNKDNNTNESGGALKFIKLYKRYIKCSEFLLKEIKNFKEKLNSSGLELSKNLKNKYDSCPANIQIAPHLMTYNVLFKHCSIVLSFYRDFSAFNKLEESKSQNKNKINNDKVKKNGYIDKSKERVKSADRIKEKEKINKFN